MADSVPEKRYTKSGEVRIAYQVFGEGPIDLVWIPGFVSNVEFTWDYEPTARFARRLGSFARVIAVIIGARIGSLAASGEVLVSSTVKDLVAGSGLTFEDRGEQELKGVPDSWRSFRAAE